MRTLVITKTGSFIIGTSAQWHDEYISGNRATGGRYEVPIANVDVVERYTDAELVEFRYRLKKLQEEKANND